MKLNFLSRKESLLSLAVLIIMVLSAGGTANALESDEINTYILSSESTIIPTWINDSENPWELASDNSYVGTPSCEIRVTTTLSLNFSSQYDVYIKCGLNHWVNSNCFSMVVDGEITYPNDNQVFRVPAGEHRIDFVATLNGSGQYARIKSITLFEYKPLETECLAEGSMPLTFENDPDQPWLTCNGYIQSMNENGDWIPSTISTTFTIDQPSLFSVQVRHNDAWWTVDTDVYINGMLYHEFDDIDKWTYWSVVLYPGTHTISIQNTHRDKSSGYYSQLRNVCLHQNWDNVTVSTPGELGVKLLQALGGKNLQDAELVKITGSLNADDWNTISQLKNIKAIDFTETDIPSIPANAFKNNSWLSTVMLPETVTSIGDKAFQGTAFSEIHIPSSVETIGNAAWYGTPLKHVTFDENSKLKIIGQNAFRKTDIMEFIMPDSVTGYYTTTSDNYYDWCVVADCSNLKKLHLSDNLTSVPRYTAYRCSSLTEVNIPKNATEIGSYAFQETSLESVTIPKDISDFGEDIFRGCKKLKKAVLNSHFTDMDHTFWDCTALDTIVLPCATPPSIHEDPFANVNRANITLIVPDFAVDAYRTDSYWYNFTNTVAGDEASISDYWALRGDLILDSGHVMQGTPSVEMMTGSKLTMQEDATQNFNEFTYRTNESSPASFLSKSNNLTANNLITNFYVSEANKWFFFSPVSDVRMSDITYPATDSWVIRYYDGERRATQNSSTGNWVNVPADGTLRRGQGYIIQANAAGWLNMPVAAENHPQFFGANEVTIPLADNVCENEANAGWNFVANTYPCYYDIYYINMQAPITVWNGSTYRAYALNDGDNLALRPMQPFFVQKTASDITASMPLAGRSTSSSISRAPRADKPQIDPNRNLLNLELSKIGGEQADDYTRIVINDDASLDYERNCDASKFMSMDTQVAQMFSLGTGNLPMAINERPYDNGIVNLGIYLPEAGETYSIYATRSDRQVWIYDAATGIEQDLTSGNYEFAATKAGYDYERFSIRFSPMKSRVNIIDETVAKVDAGKGVLSVTASGNETVTIYAADGTVVTDTIGSVEINLPAGVYLVKIDEKSFKTIVK